MKRVTCTNTEIRRKINFTSDWNGFNPFSAYFLIFHPSTTVNGASDERNEIHLLCCSLSFCQLTYKLNEQKCASTSIASADDTKMYEEFSIHYVIESMNVYNFKRDWNKSIGTSELNEFVRHNGDQWRVAGKNGQSKFEAQKIEGNMNWHQAPASETTQ